MSQTTDPNSPPYPLHPSIVSRINPEYAAFYKAHISDKQQVHLQPIATSRSSGVLIPGAGPLLPVGSTQDLAIPRTCSEGPNVPLRVFTPRGPPPPAGWPACLYFHGGGWVLGTIETENVVCSNLCARGGAVVISVDYRLAPEHPFPAAVEDCWEAVQWVVSAGKDRLGLDLGRLATGGSSAGGNLAAVMCQRAVVSQHQQQQQQQQQQGGDSSSNSTVNNAKNGNNGNTSNSGSNNSNTSTSSSNSSSNSGSSSSSSTTKTTTAPPQFRLQLLSVPVVDNTATPETTASWRANEHAPALPAPKMMWYRRHYLPNEADWLSPEASPLLWRGDWAKLPRAVIVCGELDVLRDEGVAFGNRLRSAGVRADVHVLQGQPHPFLAMDGVLEDGRRAITYFCEALKEL